MNNILLKLKRFLLKIDAKRSTRLPVGLEEHKAWADSIIFIYDLPDNDSVRFALAVAILHRGETDFYISKQFFGKAMLKGAANEVASFMMKKFKDDQAQRIAAAASNVETK